jgi:hypothetical protein
MSVPRANEDTQPLAEWFKPVHRFHVSDTDHWYDSGCWAVEAVCCKFAIADKNNNAVDGYVQK